MFDLVLPLPHSPGRRARASGQGCHWRCSVPCVWQEPPRPEGHVCWTACRENSGLPTDVQRERTLYSLLCARATQAIPLTYSDHVISSLNCFHFWYRPNFAAVSVEFNSCKKANRIPASLYLWTLKTQLCSKETSLGTGMRFSRAVMTCIDCQSFGNFSNQFLLYNCNTTITVCSSWPTR